MKEHPDATIQVTGGGSGTGIAALINGSTQICQASRPMKDEEKTGVKQQRKADVQEFPVALDALAVYVNKQNPIDHLSMDQIKGIFLGEITSWKEVGGPDAPITRYGRENSSGTYEYFKEHVLGGKDFAASVQTLPGTAAVVNAVAQDANGIGYGGAAYAKGIKVVAVKPADGGPAVAPTAENVKSGAYPISRSLFFYLRRAPEGLAADFVAYALSDSGQAIVSQVGYFPIR
jgi:phosphate transport system substrate-binding protein